MKTVHLERNNVGPIGTKSISLALQINYTLRVLHLSDNCIGDEGAEFIGRMLMIDKSLKGLDLSENGIGLDGIKAISLGLHENKSLLSLRLYCNKINDDGAIFIGQMLRNNHALASIDIRENNQAASNGLEAIALSLRHSDSLTTLCPPAWNLLNEDMRYHVSTVFLESLEGWNDTMITLAINWPCPLMQHKINSISKSNKKRDRIAPKKLKPSS